MRITICRPDGVVACRPVGGSRQINVMKVLDLAMVLMLTSAATASAQNASESGRPGAGPCPGFGAKPFNWDLVVSDPDTVARLKAGGRVPRYPKSMFRDGYRATALVSFVVDTTGRVVPGTSSVIEASDDVYRQWACDTVKELRFEPAQKSGQHVVALTAQPFIFTATVRWGVR
jgi:TonB family protein